MAEESTKIIRIIIDSSKAVDGGRAAQRALEQIEKQTGSMAAAMDKAQASVAHVGTLLKVQLALAAAEVAARLYEMARQAFEAASGMEEVAQQVGLAAREFQGLQFVAAQSGVKLDEVGGAVSKFSIKMGEAADGSKEVIESLKRLGVQNLDLTGKLRPTADLMAEVAQKITDIEDPARRSAAIVDFFGKTGTKFLPVLEEMAKGLGNASLQAEKFGAMISDSTIRRLDELDDRFQRSALQHRASLANQLADAVDYGDKINSYLAGLAQKTNQAIKPAAGSSDAWLDSLREGFDKAAVMIARFNAQVVAVFKELPDQLGKAIVDGLNAALRTIGSGLSVINDFIASKLSYVGINAKTGGVPIPQLPGGGASVTDFRTRVGAAGDAAAYQLREQQLAETERIEQARVEARRQAASGQYAGSSRRFREDALTTTRTTGGGTSAPKASGGGGGDTSEDKIEKLRITLTAAAVAQDAMTAAAMRGDVAFQAQQAHADALQKAIEVYGGKLDATNPKVVALAGELEKLILRTKEGAAAQAFVVATTELEKQNVLLEAQNKLMNEAPEIQAREIALIKAKQEAEKGGTAITAEQVNQRRAAIEQNETLKLQAEQMKAANELWTEPLKQGLRSIQTAGADAWETILETGNLSFQSLGEVFTKTLRRMAAEFLALATIRPILTMAVDVVGPSGLGKIGRAHV